MAKQSILRDRDRTSEEAEWHARHAQARGTAPAVIITDLVALGLSRVEAKALIDAIEREQNLNASMAQLEHLDLEAMTEEMDAARARDERVARLASRALLNGFFNVLEPE
jgi:outer membrane murein-binding lipoprotein Lpp